jgi:hypothetical protein
MVLAIAIAFTAVVWVVPERMMPQASQGCRQMVAARLARSPNAVCIHSWAADGRTLIGDVNRRDNGWDLWLFSASGDDAPVPFIKTQFNEREARISPDDRWM